jgi:ergothioneine biosynthesis protein EgtB
MDRLVTVGEYMEFMEAGGYQNFRYWLSEGWGWVQENDIQSPLYWEKRDGQWMHFTLGGLQVLKPEASLTHVSLFEADAYAAWKGYRLPTEFEWEAASAQFKHGQLWEWTNSAYLPYPGFEKAPGAIGEYNGKFMINQMVLRGSSVATAPGHTRTSYRNFFHPDKQWQFTGIRLAK